MQPILQTAKIEWRNKIPYVEQFDDYYFSSDDGLAESEYVFLQHNQIPSRFAKITQPSIEAGKSLMATRVFRIAETGFGSGLNFLLTVKAWIEAFSADLGAAAEPRCQLHFISFEKYPMQLADLRKALQIHPQVAAYAEALASVYPHLLPGWHDIYLFSGKVRLTLWFGDALNGLAECDALAKVDAWYLDGFTPSRNADMWGPKLYQQMVRLSSAATSFATFTVAGEVRRGLEAAGFVVNKASGYGKKREMCFGHLKQLRPVASKTPWFDRFQPSIAVNSPQTAIVVGAGLAGASTAYALAQRGFKVTVIERHAQVASEASGNLAGTLHPLITVDWNLRSAFYHLGYMASLRWLQPWLEAGSIKGNLQGMLQLAVNKTARSRLLESIERVPLPIEYATWLNAEQASAKLELPADKQLDVPAMFYPQSGWIYPTSVVQACLQSENIQLITDCEVVDFTQTETLWHLSTSKGNLSANNVVFATGSLGEGLQQKLGLPIRPVKGQVTHLSADDMHYQPKFAMTHEGYSSPAVNGSWVTGATFEAPDMNPQTSVAGHEHNLKTASNALPDWLGLPASVNLEQLQGRVAFRPTTPDHLPIIGAVPDWQWLEKNYCQQSHTHAVYRYPSMQYQAGLFVNNGHGPRGLMSVFLAAELLAAQITGEALPMSQGLYAACHPARFKIRHWRSGKGCEPM